MRIGLIDVDSHNFPNLPLMKISAWHKQQGDTVEWWTPEGGQYDKVYASKIFSESKLPVICNATEVQIGGSGIDLKNKLPFEIEHSTPDYTLYPQHKFALGCLTRGCPRKNHGFCITPEKDGCVSVKTTDLSEFWTGQKEIYLLDQNILACKDRIDLLNQLADSGAVVDFGGGTDARFMTDEVIEVMHRIKVKDFHFAWDDPREDLFPQFLKIATSGLKTTKRVGIGVYVLTNYWSTHEEDLARCYKLRILGFNPYVMIYDKQKFVDSHGKLLPDVWDRYTPDQIYHFKLCQHLQRWTTARRIWGMCPTIEQYHWYTNFIEKWPEILKKHTEEETP
ncbi:MAG: radical SAM protein [Oscillospiraceae bacterium]|nr:radical SAM protein [Oscillospiraceae bacterium]